MWFIFDAPKERGMRLSTPSPGSLAGNGRGEKKGVKS
jgi:hypothetical protein